MFFLIDVLLLMQLLVHFLALTVYSCILLQFAVDVLTFSVYVGCSCSSRCILRLGGLLADALMQFSVDVVAALFVVGRRALDFSLIDMLSDFYWLMCSPIFVGRGALRFFSGRRALDRAIPGALVAFVFYRTCTFCRWWWACWHWSCCPVHRTVQATLKA